MSSDQRDPPSTALAIHARGLGKCFHHYARPLDRLKQLIAGDRRRYYQEYWALQDIDLDVAHGEVLGIVGRNGAGKSTLLQLLCGTLTPTSGQLTVNGRVAALLELGAGFNPEFTGRENVYMNAAILGLSPAEIEAHLDDILAFADIGHFVDQPVKTYSSGMFVRLAFAVATSVDPDILVVDEALSVGDGAFARKSFDRIMAMREAGKTILFCSHSMYQIEAFCDRVVWLEQGRLRSIGIPVDVVGQYTAALDGDGRPAVSDTPSDRPHPQGHARIARLSIRVNGEEGRHFNLHPCRDELTVEVHFTSDPAMPPPSMGVTLDYGNQFTVSSAVSRSDQVTLTRQADGSGWVTVTFPQLALRKGEYTVSVYLGSEDAVHIYDAAPYIATLSCGDTAPEPGKVILPHHWQCGTHTTTITPPPPSPPAVRWQARPATAQDVPALRSLFARVFGHPITAGHWDWKYAGTTSPGVIAESPDGLAAFYGGMPRQIQYFGTPATAIQIGDVMVAPEERGVLTRKGAFFQAASFFLEHQIGFDKPYLVGFGFPNRKSMTLAARVGLYADVGEIVELSWPASPGRTSLRLTSRRIDGNASPALRQQIATLCARFHADLQPHVVCLRSWAWLEHRFINHPTHEYQLHLITQRFTGTAVAVVVTRQHPDHIEVMDIIGPLAHFPQAVRWLQRTAGQQGASRLTLWLSRSMVGVFADTAPEAHPIDVLIPCNIWSDGPSPDVLRDHWWLTGGDTDFR